MKLESKYPSKFCNTSSPIAENGLILKFFEITFKFKGKSSSLIWKEPSTIKILFSLLTILTAKSYLSLEMELLISIRASPNKYPLDEKSFIIKLDSLLYKSPSFFREIFPFTNPSYKIFLGFGNNDEKPTLSKIDSKSN